MTRVVLGLLFDVVDPERLRAYAEQRYAACWPDERAALTRGGIGTLTLAECVYEALIGSSEGPDLVDIGLQIEDETCRYANDPVRQA